MKRNSILLGDILACLILIAWLRFGPWIDWMGFAVYHSRGDVWLASPPAAISFFRAMVSTGAAIFATLFAASSCLLLLRRRHGYVSADRTGGRFFCSAHDAFYGDGRKLIIKYLALVFSLVASPYFYSLMWRFQGGRSFHIAGGLVITAGLFIVITVVGNLLVVRTSPQHFTLPTF